MRESEGEEVREREICVYGKMMYNDSSMHVCASAGEEK